MISDKYIHSKVEDKIYAYWEKNKLFKPQKNSKKFSIVIPPPNVTGSLHMGHALNNSIQDFLVRYYRMNNYETLWQPGTDHAGIATQALVERKLEKENLNKNSLGREKFIEKVWEWKNEYGDIIINQLKKLGCSCDWSRNAFTMDENLSKSVIKVFVDLHKKKLIYKAEKLVNWDTVLKTAISDLEVDQREMNSKIYYIRYPIENSSEGQVNETLDCLSNYNLNICGEIEMVIHHSLMGLNRSLPREGFEIHAHEQTFAQCKHWLDSYCPNVKRVAVASNSQAAKNSKKEPKILAIAGSLAADRYGLEIIKENIEDYSDNTTRFITIGLQDVSVSGKDKTSIIVTTKNESGALYRILKPINDNGINLTHITYRPSRVDKWNYSFFLDLEGHKDEKNVKSLLEQLKQASLEIKVLGSYPKAQI